MTLLVALGAAAAVAASAVLWRALHRRSLRKKAELRLEWEDFKGAAALLERLGETERAAKLWARAGDPARAMELCLSRGDRDGAIEALRGVRAEAIAAALPRLESSSPLSPEQLRRLAEAASESGVSRLAAELFERAGDPERARGAWLALARSRAAAAEYLEAVALFDKLGEARLAAQTLLEATRRSADPARRLALAREASARFQSLGETAAAAEALTLAGELEAAVQLLIQAGHLRSAAQLLSARGLLARAADLLERDGDLAAAARLRQQAGDARGAAALLERSGDPAAAASLLLEAQDPVAAAQVWARAGQPGTAAELLAKSGDVDGAVRLLLSARQVEPAAELLARKGRLREAAALFQQAGNPDRASLLLAQAGDLHHRARVHASRGEWTLAARAYLDANEPAEARAALARMTPLTPEGHFLLGRACLALNDPAAAAEHFSLLLASRDSGIPRPEALYGLARALERMDRIPEAIAAYEELVALEPDLRDAFLRLKMVRARLAPEAQTPPPAEGADPSDLPPEWGGRPTTPPPAKSSAGGSGEAGVPRRYQVEAELGRGSMGVVYRAHDSQLDRVVAIKVLSAAAGADQRIRDYFLREARAIAQFLHPNIVTLFDAGLEGSAPYLVMEHVLGEDLRTRLQRGPLPSVEAVRMTAAIASALDYAHARRIVHRDVKPENILLGKDGTPKLMDFGVAHVMRDTARQATVVGTPVYMAPEQIRGENIGGWTDVYALGAVLYECLVGAPPFEPAGALYHHVHTPPPSPRQMRPEIPSALNDLVLRCLAKKPEARPAPARVLSEELLEIASRMRAA